MPRRGRWLTLLLVVSTITMCVALGMVFPPGWWPDALYTPDEKLMGAVQRVFYFHVPAAIITYAAVGVLIAGSLAYLWTRRLKWDNLSLAATETGLLFCTIVLTTGPIWGKSAWGTWWTWEARLTTTLILWILLAGVLMVRAYAESRELAARLSAVLGIAAGVDIFIIKKAVEWWRGQHPEVFREGSLAPDMARTFAFCVLVFFLLFGLLLALRYRLAELDDRAERLSESLARR